MTCRQSLIDLATGRFAGYAAMDAPELPGYRTGALQVRLCRWQAKAYGLEKGTDLHLALGIVEELGEFEEAVEHADEDDAIADVMIYSIQLCTSLRLDYGTLLRYAFEERKNVPPTTDIIHAGRLCHAILKGSQGIRGLGDRSKYRERVANCLIDLYINLAHSQVTYCDMFELVEKTAETVMKRVPKLLPESNRAETHVEANS